MKDVDWRYIVFLLFSHHSRQKLDHTIHLNFKKHDLFICSRCTGIAAGLLAIFVPAIFGLTPPLELFVPLIALLPLVAVVDWFTHSAKMRQSKTWIRSSSGFFLGISEALGLLLLFKGFYFYFLIILGVALIYALTVYLIALKTKCLDTYLKEMNTL
jgi:uncharacterized membrane protein